MGYEVSLAVGPPGRTETVSLYSSPGGVSCGTRRNSSAIFVPSMAAVSTSHVVLYPELTSHSLISKRLTAYCGPSRSLSATSLKGWPTRPALTQRAAVGRLELPLARRDA